MKESVNDVLRNYNRQDQLIRKKKCDFLYTSSYGNAIQPMFPEYSTQTVEILAGY